ncbi:hypothetical protein Plhal703r1_c01g0006351 [Plasmopara halstedii]
MRFHPLRQCRPDVVIVNDWHTFDFFHPRSGCTVPHRGTIALLGDDRPRRDFNTWSVAVAAV